MSDTDPTTFNEVQTFLKENFNRDIDKELFLICYGIVASAINGQPVTKEAVESYMNLGSEVIDRIDAQPGPDFDVWPNPTMDN